LSWLQQALTKTSEVSIVKLAKFPEIVLIDIGNNFTLKGALFLFELARE